MVSARIGFGTGRGILWAVVNGDRSFVDDGGAGLEEALWGRPAPTPTCLRQC